VKWVSGYPANPARGLPYISGLLVLNDAETGLPAAVMDAAWITAMRTAAASAVAAKYLANPEPRVLCVIGCGVQGRSHVEAMTAAFASIRMVKAFDISPKILEAYLADMSRAYPAKTFEGCASPREAVQDADIIVTAGPIRKIPEPGIEDGWVKLGAFASPVDFDTYWARAALREFDKILTDDEPQFQYYQTQGYFGDFPQLYGDVSDVVCSKRRGRSSADERIMSVHLGLAIEDAAVAKRLFDVALTAGIGRWLER
jgi:ornithine cyclodeaminase/alanine dehydrogenase